MIELKNVTKIFEKNKGQIIALSDVTLTIEKGDIYGVIGYSGAGKSTLIRLINYLEQPTKGFVHINNEVLGQYKKVQLREKRKDIGMIFQHFNLLESKTVFENIAIPLKLIKKSKTEIKDRVEELLTFVGLEDRALNYPNELSGGQKQRVGIARALALNPSILLCDEATSALDPETTQSILQLLKKINEQYNITIVLITHEMEVVKNICNKVAVMEKGEIVEKGPLLEVFGYPQHKTTQKFLGTIYQNELPEQIRTQIPSAGHQICKLKYIDDTKTLTNVVNELSKRNIEFTILYTNSLALGSHIITTVYLEIISEKLEVQSIIEDVISNKIKVEVLHNV